MNGEKEKKVLQTIEAPGEYKNEQTNNHTSIDICINAISSWLRRLHDDLENINVLSTTSDMDNIQNLLDEKIPNEEEQFSNQEKNNLESKLQELQERIEKLELSGEINKDDANHSIKILEDSKQNLQTYPKKAWYLNFYNRMKATDGVMKTLLNVKDKGVNFLEFIKDFI